MGNAVVSRMIGIEYGCVDLEYIKHTLIVEHRGMCPRCKKEINKINTYNLFAKNIDRGEKQVVGFHELGLMPSGCKYAWTNIVSLSAEPENKDSPIGQITWVMV